MPPPLRNFDSHSSGTNRSGGLMTIRFQIMTIRFQIMTIRFQIMAIRFQIMTIR